VKVNIIDITKTKQFTSEQVMWISIVIFFTILGLYYLEIIKPHILLTIVLFISALTPIGTNIYGNYEYFPKNYVVKYQANIETDHIDLESQKLYFEAIEKIEFNINDWFGKKIVTNMRPYGSGPKLSQGINNSIKLEIKNSLPIILHFQIETEEHFVELANWIKSLYKFKIKIVEKYENSTSFGLNHLNYNEIQEFKKKYTT
jgi:hypothetical protein